MGTLAARVRTARIPRTAAPAIADAVADVYSGGW